MVPDDPERVGPADPSYAYGGYAPVSLRVIAAAVHPPAPGWASLEEALRPLPGPLFERRPPGAPAPPGGRRRRSVLVFFVGGVSSAEVSALRVMAGHGPDAETAAAAVAGLASPPAAGSAAAPGPWNLVVGTTRLCGGDGFLAALADTPPNALKAAVQARQR